MTDVIEDTKPVSKRKAIDYTDPQYWNGLIKMSLSKFFILCVLSNRSMHGYEVAKAVEASTHGCCSPTPGALYPVLREFEEGGYVTAHETIVQGRSRKVYTLTDKGREAFRVAAQVWLDVGKCVTESAERIEDNGACC